MESVLLVSICCITVIWAVLLVISFRAFPPDVIIDESAPTDLPAVAPFVSVLVPARDEEANIARCLESLLGMDYPAFEVIVANDRSSDRTEQIVRDLAAKDPRLRLLNVTHCPEGWTGKTHALHLAAQQARGEWLLFTDADTWHSRTCLRRAMSHILKRNVDMFSTVGRQENRTIWEKLLTPPLGLSLMIWYPPTLVNSARWRVGFANGQFIIIRRKTYDAIGGHEAVKGELLEDIAMGKRAKEQGFNLRLVVALDLYTTRMYPDVWRFIRGWSRILLSGMDKSAARLAAFVLFGLVFSACPAFLAVIYGFEYAGRRDLESGIILGASVLSYLLSIWTIGNTYFASGADRRWVVLNPFIALGVLAIATHAFCKAINRNSKIEWRGVHYSSR